MKKTIGLAWLLLVSACLNDTPEGNGKDQRPELVRATETAHHKEDFLSHEVVWFDMALNWQGRPLQATVVQRTNGTRIRIRKQNGSDILFDGSEDWLAPATQQDADARFDLFAWHYFFCLPWKLSDPGARWQPLSERVFEGISCNTGRLRFAPGTGDAPDDWFLVFSDKKEGLLRGAVYVVTFGGKTLEAAEKEPRAVYYSDFRMVDGIPIAHKWTFYRWITDSLEDKKQIGSAIISNIRFADERPEDFAVPAGAQKI